MQAARAGQTTMRTSFQERSSIVELPAQRPQVEAIRDEPATKAGVAWIMIRLVGFSFLAQACVSAYQLVIQLGMIFNLFTVASMVGAEPNGQTFRLWIGVVLGAAQIGLFGLLAYYLLRKGRAVHRMLMFIPRSARE
jgi:hypothetical protein